MRSQLFNITLLLAGLLVPATGSASSDRDEYPLSGVRALLEGAPVNRTRVVMEQKSGRMALERSGTLLNSDEKDCLVRQRKILRETLGRMPSSTSSSTYRIAYELISSRNRDFDSERLLTEPTITGPFKGMLSYKVKGTTKPTKVLHLPVVVFSDGTCRPFESERILAELPINRSL